MNKQSYWLTTGPRRVRQAPLSRDLETDVLVIGGGITGITAALLLRRAGKKVVLLERDGIGLGETGHTTAHLTYMTDTRLSELASTFGENHALASWDAGAAAMAQIHTLADELQADCELREVPGFLATDRRCEDREKEKEKLWREAHLAIQHGFDVEHVESIQPTGMPGIRFANQLKFHPIKYLRALAQQALHEGVEVYESSPVGEFIEGSRSVKVGPYTVSYEKTVIATHVPLQGQAGTWSSLLFQTKLYGYSTYAIQALVPRGMCPEMIWSDTASPFHYLRVDRHGEKDSVVFGGEDHRTGQEDQTEKCYANLEEELGEMLPVKKPEHRWCGQVIETPDGLPYIGWVEEDQFVATGFAGNGFTFGTLSGMMACDAITGRKNPWADLFSPQRKKLVAAWDYVKENADYPYYLAKDFATAVEGTDLQLVGCNEGKIIKLDGQRLAVYRDRNGQVAKMSAICPHLGCIVHWNSAERTWDCPCHGSRFAADGKLFAGPAEQDLARVK